MLFLLLLPRLLISPAFAQGCEADFSTQTVPPALVAGFHSRPKIGRPLSKVLKKARIRNPDFQAAVQNFERRALHTQRLSIAHLLHAFYRMDGILVGAQPARDLAFIETGSPEVERLWQAVVEKANLRTADPMEAARIADEIYKIFALRKIFHSVWVAYYAKPEDRGTLASGHHRVGWLAVNFFLLKNGFQPYGLLPYAEYFKVHVLLERQQFRSIAFYRSIRAHLVPLPDLISRAG